LTLLYHVVLKLPPVIDNLLTLIYQLVYYLYQATDNLRTFVYHCIAFIDHLNTASFDAKKFPWFVDLLFGRLSVLF